MLALGARLYAARPGPGRGVSRWMLGCFAVYCTLIPAVLGAPAPLVSDPQIDETAERATLTWRHSAADDALEGGYPAVAMGLYRGLLENPLLENHEQQAIGLRFITAALQDGNYPAAAAMLTRFSDMTGAPWQLRRAMVAFQSGDVREADRYLRRVDGDDLSSDDQAWLSLVLGLVREAEGQMRTAQTHFAEARERAQDPVIRAAFEVIMARHQLLSGVTDESIVTDLRRRLQSMQGQRGGFEIARLLTISLAQLGRSDEAIAVIESQLTLLGVEERDLRAQFLLLLGLIAPPDSGRGRLALQEVLRQSDDRLSQRMALQLLASRSMQGDAVRAFKDFLGELIGREEQHGLLDELLVLRARLSIKEGAYHEAGDDLRRLIDLFPGSDLVRVATRLLAYISWNRLPPQYRTAADYLNRLRSDLPAGPERSRLSALMGDCYFLNGDFVSASEAYQAALNGASQSEYGVIVFQQVLSEIRAGRLQAAELLLDAARDATLSDPLNRWRAEWNLIDALKSNGDVQRAFARIRALLSQAAVDALPVMLQVRLLWLEAQLALEAGQPEGTEERIARIMWILDTASDDAIAREDRELIGARAMLLQGEAFLELEHAEEGFRTFHQLRERYPKSDAAALTHLIEARYYASHNHLVEAQQRLVMLTDLPDAAEFAPIALWEAALMAEQRGLHATYLEAIAILERLVTAHPNHQLAYHARLKQADLSRMLNDFAAAQLIYEGLLNRYPQHPERHRAELSRADVFLAQSGQMQGRLEDAIVIYERLFDLVQLPVDLRAEAGYKWGFALRQTGANERSRDVYWLVIRQLLTERSNDLAAPAAQGLYWIARAVFDLSSLLEEEQRYDESRRVLDFIARYGLPGQRTARARLERYLTAEQ